MKKNIVKLLVLVVALMSVLFAFASCGCSHEEEVIPAKEATCAAEGLTEGKKCKLCGEILVKQEPVAKKEHAYQNVEKQDATCEEDGFEAGVKCLVCGDVKSGCEVIPAGHVTIDIAEKPATCYATGTAAGKRCTVCLKDVEGFEELPMTSHNLEDVAEIAATCVAAGSSAGKKCSNDGCSYFEGLTTLDPLGHKPVAANKLEPTCTTDGHEAGTVCERCEAVIDGCAVLPMLGHSIKNENINITKEPDLGIVGEGTATCDVCKQNVTLEIPAKLGGRWDYTSDTDTLYMSKTGATGFVNELVNDTETGKTYVKVGIVNPGIHPNSPDKPADATLAAAGEANFVWRPNENVTLGEMRADNMFVFTTDIQIASAITKWVPTGTQYDNKNGPDKYYEGWLFNPSVSTNPSTSNTGDAFNNHVGANPVHKDKTTSGELASVKIGNAVLDVAKWYNLKLVYRLADDNVAKYVVEIYVDGTLAATTNPADHRANVTGNPILDFRIKFKNARCFDELIFYFDNTTFEELPYTPATPDEPGTPDTPDTPTPGTSNSYTYEDTKIPTKTGSTSPDNVTLEIVKDGENNVLHVTGNASAGEALIYWAFDGLGALGTDNYFKMTTKIKIGDIVGNNYANNWIANFGIADAVEDRVDKNRLGVNYNFKDVDGKTVSYINGGEKYEFTTNEWVTLEYWFYADAENWYQIVTVDGVWVGEMNAKLSDKTIDENIKGIAFKTKNLKNFTAYDVWFDDTTLTEGKLADVTLPSKPACEHELGEVTTTVAPAVGTPGKGTAVCSKCQETVEVEIPALPGGVWNFEGNDPDLYVKENTPSLKIENKSEGGRTYISYAYGEGDNSGEWVIGFYAPNLGKLTADNYVVFEADINLAEILPTDSYASSTSSWFMYTGLTDDIAGGDFDTVSRTWYVDKNENGTFVRMNNKTTGVEAPYQTWFNLKVTFIRNAEDPTKIDVAYYLNGNEWYVQSFTDVINSTKAGEEKNGTPYLESDVLGFRFKFKSKKNLENAIYCFDNVKLYTEKYVPAPDFDLTVEEAIAMGQTFEHNTYSTDKYYVTGVITEVYNTTYGNMKIKDEAGNIITVYGTFSADGATRYDKLETKPVAGDTVTVYGVVGKYNTDSQLKNAWITEHTAHTCEFADATCTAPKTCTKCGKTEGEALAHNYVEGTCTACGAKENVTPPADVVPAPGKAYILTANNKNGAVYFAGSLMSGRFNGTTDQAAATVVYVEEGATEGAYYLYFMMNGTTKKYLKIADESKGAGFADTASAATVFEWNATRKTMVVADDANNRALALDPSKTFTTFSTYDASQTNYDYAEFVEVEVPEQPGDSEDAEDKPANPGIGGIGGGGFGTP